jgi:outer membrane protein OmpA-like peptidoglycan-associated protein
MTRRGARAGVRHVRRLTAAVVIMGGAVGGCAVPTSLSPTPALLDQASRAVQRAQADDAVRYAPDEFLSAKKALNEAMAAQSKGVWSAVLGFGLRRDQTARLEAYHAWYQAELASTKTRAAKEQEMIASLKLQIIQLETVAKQYQAETEAARQERARQLAEAAQAQAIAKAESEAAAKERALREKAQAELRAAMASVEKERALQRTQELERAKQELEGKLTDAIKEIAQVKEEKRGLIISLSDILFDSGKATLLPGTQRQLAQLGKILSSYSDRQIVVEGYTDNVGSNAFNLQLSEARAESVRNALIEQGVSPDLISAMGYGQSKPVASNDTPQGRAQNRRVEIVVLNPPSPSAPSEGTASAATGPETPPPSASALPPATTPPPSSPAPTEPPAPATPAAPPAQSPP